ncbi:MAG: glutamate--tRNA ligase [Candidatus Heimdallarchaeota archaeon]|nr:glutamate--tRNA ligase [Candidatus Heimdallarchaeota archaeon]
MNAEDIIFKETLINAYKYGSADTKIVFQKLMSYYPELRQRAKELKPIVDSVVEKINAMLREEIESIVEDKYPEDIIEEKEEKDFLPPLVNAEKGKVVVRYPPEPSKHPHIGQMLSFCINHLIAERFEGKRILRFDDTNPSKIKEEYYDSFREAILWMGLHIDEEVRASDYMNLYYEKAKELLTKNDAYICTCSREIMSKLRERGERCSCNLENTVETNHILFDKMLAGGFEAGEAIVRLRGDMESKNHVLRDPVLLRVSTLTHAIHEDKFKVWPMYDFESPIMENITGVTHILRSSGFGKMREELQSLIAKKLGIIPPNFTEYRRFSIIGAPTQGRIIRELVDDGTVTGWDDFRLVTYQALRKRGIQPEVFIEIVKRIGATKSATSIDWSLIFAINRKYVEPTSKHLFFVQDPVEIKIINHKPEEVEIAYHPKNNEIGKRTVAVNDVLYLSGDDREMIKVGNVLRMKDLYNIKISKEISNKEYEAEFVGYDLLSNIPRIQWVSEYVPVEIIKPEMLYLNKRINKNSLKEIQGYGEINLKKLKVGEIIQLERFGYVKINHINEKIKMNYIHG